MFTISTLGAAGNKMRSQIHEEDQPNIFTSNQCDILPGTTSDALTVTVCNKSAL